MNNKVIAERKMTDYIIKQPYQSDCFTYYHTTKEIGFKMTTINLTDDELLEYISDAITHEHIHKILDELFNYTVSKLFDGIEHLFRNHVLHEKCINNRNCNLINEHTNKHETYMTFIRRCGFGSFLLYYDITQNDIFHANKICSDRLYKIDLNQAKNVTWKKLKESQEKK